MKDFTKKRTKIEFQAYGDIFEASPAIPADILTTFVVKFSDVENLPSLKRVEAMTEVLEMVLKPASFELIQKRKKDREKPLDLDQLNEIIIWLMEQYGQRPTQPSSDLLPGQHNQESGTNLTAPIQVAVSTFNP